MVQDFLGITSAGFELFLSCKLVPPKAANPLELFVINIYMVIADQIYIYGNQLVTRDHASSFHLSKEKGKNHKHPLIFKTGQGDPSIYQPLSLKLLPSQLIPSIILMGNGHMITSQMCLPFWRKRFLSCIQYFCTNIAKILLSCTQMLESNIF